jgi:hypothetical protein
LRAWHIQHVIIISANHVPHHLRWFTWHLCRMLKTLGRTSSPMVSKYAWRTAESHLGSRMGVGLDPKTKSKVLKSTLHVVWTTHSSQPTYPLLLASHKRVSGTDSRK